VVCVCVWGGGVVRCVWWGVGGLGGGGRWGGGGGGGGGGNPEVWPDHVGAQEWRESVLPQVRCNVLQCAAVCCSVLQCVVRTHGVILPKEPYIFAKEP